MFYKISAHSALILLNTYIQFFFREKFIGGKVIDELGIDLFNGTCKMVVGPIDQQIRVNDGGCPGGGKSCPVSGKLR